MHLVGVDGGGRPFWVQQEFFSAALSTAAGMASFAAGLVSLNFHLYFSHNHNSVQGELIRAVVCEKIGLLVWCSAAAANSFNSTK